MYVTGEEEPVEDKKCEEKQKKPRISQKHRSHSAYSMYSLVLCCRFCLFGNPVFIVVALYGVAPVPTCSMASKNLNCRMHAVRFHCFLKHLVRDIDRASL